MSDILSVKKDVTMGIAPRRACNYAMKYAEIDTHQTDGSAISATKNGLLKSAKTILNHSIATAQMHSKNCRAATRVLVQLRNFCFKH